MPSTLRAMILLSALTLLSACETFSKEVVVQIGPVPSDLQVCFDRMVEFPDVVTLSEKDVVDLIGELRLSETEKALCGERLLEWIEDQRV